MIMMTQRKISVCIATYNGQKFIAEQIDSILNQLSEIDEVILVDDCSSDNTVDIIERYNDQRIKLIRNEQNFGHVYSFSKAISLSSNDIIILSDQDDIWREGRVSKMIETLCLSGKSVLSSNSYFIDENGSPATYFSDPVRFEDSENHMKNILGIFLGSKCYFGCAMAFKRDVVKIILPIPKYVESHDLWIAFAGNMIRSNIHLDNETLFRRIHGGNASILNRSMFNKIKSRLIFIRSLITLSSRIFREKINCLILTPEIISKIK